MGLQTLCLALLYIFSVVCAALSAEGEELPCQRECGGISVPYPFGFGSQDCYEKGFDVNCDDTAQPPKLYLGENIPLLSISVDNGTVDVEIDIAYTCYDKSGESRRFNQGVKLVEGSPYTFSTTNKFTAIGCDTVALFSYDEEEQFSTGCVSLCNSSTTTIETVDVTTCSKEGCCQTTVPQNLKRLDISLTSFYEHENQLQSNPCSYGFVADPTWLKNSLDFSLKDYPEKHPRSQLVLDWAVQGKCGDGEHTCGRNANCNMSSNGPGYGCSCREGFQGNPYTETGCEDINECDHPNNKPCKWKCQNTPGGYTCLCPFARQPDGKGGCRISIVARNVAIGLIAVVFCILLATLIASLTWAYKRKIQEINHRNNGGSLLKHLSVKTFKATQLEMATNNFNAEQLLGEGGNGWVYKGLLADTIEIAVKKSKNVNQNQIEQFLNEADVVSKINHKNVVKLLGVCLESKVPMLVYEFVPNGTLYQHIHGNSRILDTWHICLRVIAETARALDYMHSLAYPPIIHRDIKSANILLDVQYTAKVADFGASKLIPLDRTIAPTEGQGTIGYLDPEYLQTGELTTKSDVYGFGVVLMEVLSKKKPLSRGTSGETISLVQVFTSAVRTDQLHNVLKVAVVTEEETKQVHLVAKLAVKCVAMPSADRPTMTEVADVLNGLSKEYKSFRVEGSGDEMLSLLDDQEVMSTSVTFDIE